MSLLVWLPMTKDLRNNGLSNITVTNTGATLDSSGKLGKCYAFTSNQRLSIPNLITTSTTDFSISFWAYVTEYSNSYACICSNRSATGGKGVAIWITAGYVRFDDGANTQGTYSFQLNTWTHIAITRTASEKCIYVNGQKIKSATPGTLSDIGADMYIGADTVSSTSYSLVGKLNDFRIYDHALSAKEVELVSRGLVAHYTLNNNGTGQPNLYDFESIASKWTTDGLTKADATDEVYGNVLKVTTGDSLSGNYRIYRNFTGTIWNQNQVYTVSFMAKASKTVTVKASRSVANYAPDFTVDTTWKRYSGTITSTTTVSGGTLSIQLATTNADLYITQVKLELGDKMTPYQPGSSDPDYTRLGFDSLVEYDVSGNGYDGTKQGTITYDPDTSKYAVSSYFEDGLTTKMTAPINLNTDAITMTVWLKSKTGAVGTGNYHIPLDIDGQYYEMSINSDGKFRQGFSINGSRIVNVTPGPDIISDKSWHMITATFDGENIKRYVDGELVQTQDAAGTLSGGSRTVYIGTYGTSTSYGTKELYESDARIYATALTADQIKELYNSSANIAKNGTMFAYEFIEN